jgi:hypothetical protein
MNLGNKSLARRIGGLTIPGILFLVSLVLIIIALVAEETGKGPDVRVIKAWVLIAAAIIGAYAMMAGLGRSSLAAAPMRIGVSLVLLVILFYVSLEELRMPRFHFLGLPATTVQLLVVLLIVGPMLVRAAKIGVADITPKDVITRMR